MGRKQKVGVGIEYDGCGMRGVRVSATGTGRERQVSVEKTCDMNGRFQQDDELLAALGRMRAELKVGSSDTVVSCVSGKQVYAAQVNTRRVPEEEMKSALRFEIRKNLPFEIAGSTIDYQCLPGSDKRSDTVEVLVTAVANALLHRHLRCLDKSGLKPTIVDTVPLAAANALWANDTDNAEEAQPPSARVALHIGPDMTTLVIDGDETTFYHRTVYFTARELYEQQLGTEIPQRERERRLNGIVEEVQRSLSFYEANYQAAPFSSMYALGSFARDDLLAALEQRVQMKVSPLNLAGSLGLESDAPSGTFDLATALALRAF